MERRDELAKAIIRVMKDVRGMEKNAEVGSGKMKYDGTKDQDVKEAFNKSMSENGLCVLPVWIEDETRVDRWEDDSYGEKVVKQSIFTKVSTRYLLLHESGQSQVIVGYGHGIDSRDKGAGKATTYALKNALLLSFLTPVGKMHDTDSTHSCDIEGVKTSRKDIKPPQRNVASNTPETEPGQPLKASQKQIKRLWALSFKSRLTIEHVKKKYGIKKPEDLLASDYEEACKTFEDNPKEGDMRETGEEG